MRKDTEGSWSPEIVPHAERGSYSLVGGVIYSPKHTRIEIMPSACTFTWPAGSSTGACPSTYQRRIKQIISVRLHMHASQGSRRDRDCIGTHGIEN